MAILSPAAVERIRARSQAQGSAVVDLSAVFQAPLDSSTVASYALRWTTHRGVIFMPDQPSSRPFQQDLKTVTVADLRRLTTDSRMNLLNAAQSCVALDKSANLHDNPELARLVHWLQDMVKEASGSDRALIERSALPCKQNVTFKNPPDSVGSLQK